MDGRTPYGLDLHRPFQKKVLPSRKRWGDGARLRESRRKIQNAAAAYESAGLINRRITGNDDWPAFSFTSAALCGALYSQAVKLLRNSRRGQVSAGKFWKKIIQISPFTTNGLSQLDWLHDIDPAFVEDRTRHNWNTPVPSFWRAADVAGGMHKCWIILFVSFVKWSNGPWNWVTEDTLT